MKLTLAILAIIVVVVVGILYDWLVYKNRGVIKSDSNEDEQIVIANPEDALAHRVRDLGNLDKDK